MDFLSNPMAMSSAALAIIVSFLGVQILARKMKKDKRNKKYHPIAGTTFNQLLNFHRLHHYMTDLAGKYRTYRLLSPFRNEIYTADPANVEYILKTNFDNYGKVILKDLLGDGIFTVDGDKWRQQRKISSHEFSTRVLRDFSSEVFRKSAAKLAHIVSEAATSNQIIDLQDLLTKSILDSLFQVAFGIELDSMCGSNEEGKNFSNAFDDSSSMTLFRYVDIFWRIKKFLNIGLEATLKKSTKIVNDFVFKLIHNKIEQMKNSKDESSLAKTTATTIAWFIYMLCKHPAVQEKVAKEVKEATANKDISNYADFAATISEEALEKMNFLHAAITETLRLYPALPADTKICFSDDTLPDGYNVKKGDMVAYQPYAMGRMKFIWGDDALEFKPERWLNEDGIFQPESPFKFTAFQAGPRICLGKEFAYRTMKIFSVVLLGCFQFKMSDENQTVNYRTMINLHIDGGLNIRAFHRNGN
ncbi:hypothetical protein CIPAW_02G165700 [Carya illinoinensis]|uniref:Cytochrome P450 n=2 Tax=Carya illinoinensis TaxID=32201 RepID=A0A8T1RF82_CARIL|nr:hypothetical protein CIPAW_02G165700 [Carya illinoinensis]